MRYNKVIAFVGVFLLGAFAVEVVFAQGSSEVSIKSTIAEVKNAKNESGRLKAIQKLQEQKPASAEDVQALLGALRDKVIDFNTTEILWKNDNPQLAPFVPILIGALEDADLDVQGAAALTLGKMRAKEAVPGLIKRFESIPRIDERSPVEERKNAETYGRLGVFIATALGLIGDPRAIPALIERREFYYLEFGETPIAWIGAPALPALLKVAKDKKDSRREHIFSIISNIKDPAAIPALKEVSVDDNADRELKRSVDAALKWMIGQDTRMLRTESDKQSIAAPVSSTRQVSLPTPTVPLPRTGQINSFAAGDDGKLERGVAWPAPRFVAGTGTESSCVVDNLTGLMWVGNPDSRKRMWAEALAYAKNLSACGHTDWRLPNRRELNSLINYGQANTAAWLDTQGFSNVLSSRYWSSTTTAYALNRAWVVQLYGGTVAPGTKTDVFPVLPVRSRKDLVPAAPAALPKTGQTTCYETSGEVTPCTGTRQDGELQIGSAWPSPRFTIGTGTDANCIIDNVTGLMWAKSPDSTMRTWKDALGYTKDFILCGHSDWRMPNINELDSLVNENQANPGAWLNTQGFSNVPDGLYWSSTTYANNTDDAWIVLLSVGHAGSFNKAFNSVYVWPVRSRQ